MPTVLIIEDDEAIAETMQLYLRQVGYRAMVAHTCKRAIAILQGIAFDVILLDYWLDEHQCADKLVPYFTDLRRVILFTAGNKPHDLASQLKLSHVLVKPCTIDEIDDVMARVLNPLGRALGNETRPETLPQSGSDSQLVTKFVTGP